MILRWMAAGQVLKSRIGSLILLFVSLVCFGLTLNLQATSSDITTREKPQRFWINDDDDSNDQDHPTSGKRDCDDDKINSIRDLEDFDRFNLYLGGLHEGIVNGKIKIGFKWRNTDNTEPLVRIWCNLSPNGGLEYLTDADVAKKHLSLKPFGEAKGSTVCMIPEKYFQDIKFSQTQPYAYFLYEGVKEGKGELSICFFDENNKQIGDGPGIWLELLNIKKMYQRGYADAHNPRMPYEYFDQLVGPDIQLETDPYHGQEFKKPWNEQSCCIVFVHGYNITYEDSTNYAETLFKRLWHKGYQGRFASFRWPTFGNGTKWPPDGAMGTYNDSEYRAWNSGAALKQFVSGMPQGYVINIAAHSMGNIVVGQALKEGMNVRHYAMLHAAPRRVVTATRDSPISRSIEVPNILPLMMIRIYQSGPWLIKVGWVTSREVRLTLEIIKIKLSEHIGIQTILCSSRNRRVPSALPLTGENWAIDINWGKQIL